MTHAFRYAGLGLAAGLLMGGAASAVTVLTTADGVIRNSLCVGFDCPNSPSFGFDTLRLQENNLRIHAEDTSSTASFPTVDWRLTFNESTNGGLSKFSVDDATNGRIPFTIEANSDNHSIYIDTGGRIGFGTNTPVVNLHVKEGNTPTLRLEQDGSQGFTPQTWDVAGNETNFFIRDATNGSLLPFRIRPSAPGNSLFVDTDGDVGLNTSSPAAPLHIRRNGVVFIQLDDTTGAAWNLQSQLNELRFSTSAVAGPEFRLQEDGDLIISGTLTQSSDKNAKMAVEPVDPGSVLDKVLALPVSAWTYIHDAEGARHMGPMAQDFHALFGLGASETGISPLDTSGVALAAIQALAEQNAAQRDLIETLTARIERLEGAQ